MTVFLFFHLFSLAPFHIYTLPFSSKLFFFFHNVSSLSLCVHLFSKYNVCSLYHTILHFQVLGESNNYLWIPTGLHSRWVISLCVWNTTQNCFGCRNFLWSYLWNYPFGGVFFICFNWHPTVMPQCNCLDRDVLLGTQREAFPFSSSQQYKTMGLYRGHGFQSNLYFFSFSFQDR